MDVLQPGARSLGRAWRGRAPAALRSSKGDPEYLLTERSRWVDEGGTWGMPGGAIHNGESAEVAAHREATEEIWPLPAYRITGIEVQDCGGGWKFYIVNADVDEPLAAYTAEQTDSTGWFTISQMTGLRLHPGIRQWITDRGS